MLILNLKLIDEWVVVVAQLVEHSNAVIGKNYIEHCLVSIV